MTIDDRVYKFSITKIETVTARMELVAVKLEVSDNNSTLLFEKTISHVPVQDVELIKKGLVGAFKYWKSDNAEITEKAQS